MINFNYLCGRKQKKSGVQKLKIFIKYDIIISVTNYKCVYYTLFNLKSVCSMLIFAISRFSFRSAKVNRCFRMASVFSTDSVKSSFPFRNEYLT